MCAARYLSEVSAIPTFVFSYSLGSGLLGCSLIEDEDDRMMIYSTTTFLVFLSFIYFLFPSPKALLASSKALQALSEYLTGPSRALPVKRGPQNQPGGPLKERSNLFERI